MPHPEINRSAELPGTWRLYFSTNEGVTWQGGSPIETPVSASSRYLRPASTNNPIGLNGREDAGWIARGGRSNSSYIELYLQQQPGYILYRYVGEPSAPLQSSNLGEIPDVSPSLASDTMRQCLAQFTERSVQFGAAARELGSTFRMVGDAATGMAHGLDAFMEGNYRKLGRMASWKKLPSAYLEYLYGWSPVSEDISNAFDSLITQADDGFDFDLKLRKKKRLEGEQRVSNRQIFDGRVTADLVFHLTQECRAVMKFILPSWYFEQLPTVSPFGTLYETTRASFIVDWFIPIGEWIGAFESAQLWPFFKGGTLSTKKERRLISYRVNNSNNYGRMTQSSVRAGSYDYSYERAVIHEMAEGIILARPSMRNPLSLSHAAQGLSLLTQVFSKWQ